MAGAHQYRIPATLPEAFNKGPGRILPLGWRNMCRRVLYTHKISRKFGLWCCGQDGNRTEYHSVSFNYFAASFSRHLAHTFPGRLRREMSRVFSASPFLCIGNDHSSLPIFGDFPEHQVIWHTISQKTPLFMSQSKNTSIQGFEHFRSDFIAVSPAFFVLTSRKTSAAGMVFSSPNLPPCVSDVVFHLFETYSEDLWYILSIWQEFRPHRWVRHHFGLWWI